MRAHVQTHILAEKFIRTEELDVEMRNGLWYAREKESQGFGKSSFQLRGEGGGERNKEGGGREGKR